MIRTWILSLSLWTVLAPAVPAEEVPLWEVGIGGFAALTPDYPASGNKSFNGLAFPTLVYRGDLVRAGDGAAARLVPFDTPRLELGVSLDASFSASSDGNPLREGMPDLGFLFEVGPEAIIRGPRFGEEGQRGEIDLALQARGVFSADFGEPIEYQGIVLEPEIRFRQQGLFGTRAGLSASIGPIFATEGLHDFFYQVDPEFARAGRPAFDADGGYLGTEARLGLGLPVGKRAYVFGGVGVGLILWKNNVLRAQKNAT